MREEDDKYLRGRVRPLPIGVSIGTRYGSAGCTLGIFVKDRDGELGFLTSAIALGVRSKEEVVYQPSALDAGTLAFRDIVGHVTDFTIADESRANYADAALVRLTEGIEAAGNKISIFPRVEVADQVLKNRAPTIENLSPTTRVAKIGRTSGYTESAITAIELSNLRIHHNNKTYVFHDIIQIDTPIGEVPFSLPGDAGAVIFTIPECQPIGLLFAAGRSDQRFITFVCRLDRILDIFDVKLL